MTSIQLRQRLKPEKCPYCHTLIHLFDNQAECKSCKATYHKECHNSVKSCVIYGCCEAFQTPPPPRPPITVEFLGKNVHPKYKFKPIQKHKWSAETLLLPFFLLVIFIPCLIVKIVLNLVRGGV